MAKKRDMSYLHTPENIAKRTKAIRRAFRKKKREAKLAAKLLPAVLPEGERPVIAYEGDTMRGKHKRPKDEAERLDVVRGLLATVAMIMGRDK